MEEIAKRVQSGCVWSVGIRVSRMEQEDAHFHIKLGEPLDFQNHKYVKL